MKIWTLSKLSGLGIVVFLSASTINPRTFIGLPVAGCCTEMQGTATNVAQRFRLEAEARIAAMPPAQQAQVR